MPLGDSLTYGYRAPGGYREKLYFNLVDLGWEVQFVGRETANPGPILPQVNHVGINGMAIGPGTPGRATLNDDFGYLFTVVQSEPEWILLLIGTNDIDLDFEIPTAPARLNMGINALYVRFPGVKMVVGLIPHMGDPVKDALAATFDDSLLMPGGVIEAQQDLGRTVVPADLYSAVSLENLYDALHPNKAGYDQMADAWTAALVGRSISGTLADPDYFGGWVGAGLTYRLENSAGVARESGTLQVLEDGSFSIPATREIGAYTLVITGSHWLTRRVPVLVGNGGAVLGAVPLSNGDIDRDNVVSVFDYGLLSDYFDIISTDERWAVVGENGVSPLECDLDGDGVVSVFDYGVVNLHFDETGD